MVSEVTGAGTSGIYVPDTHNSTAGASHTNKADPKPAVDTAGRADQVALTDTAMKLRAIERSVSQLPQVDLDKVNPVKDALASGRYHIDYEKVADRVVQFEAMLPEEPQE